MSQTNRKQNAVQIEVILYLFQTLPQQEENRPQIYVHKDEVECRNTVSMMHGGPAARMWGMGEYFQVVLYQTLLD